mmetsp:Transcript_6540/g.18070  ORF Transcript_6540/g.18070 Transcript_6540/m.18070 type:complete len:256 (-) Transcript_6540:893-1660(-)
MSRESLGRMASAVGRVEMISMSVVLHATDSNNARSSRIHACSMHSYTMCMRLECPPSSPSMRAVPTALTMSRSRRTAVAPEPASAILEQTPTRSTSVSSEYSRISTPSSALDTAAGPIDRTTSSRPLKPSTRSNTSFARWAGFSRRIDPKAVANAFESFSSDCASCRGSKKPNRAFADATSRMTSPRRGMIVATFIASSRFLFGLRISTREEKNSALSNVVRSYFSSGRQSRSTSFLFVAASGVREPRPSHRPSP